MRHRLAVRKRRSELLDLGHELRRLGVVFGVDRLRELRLHAR